MHSHGVYSVLQANTVLEMYYTETGFSGNHAWVIVGNPVVLSSSIYTIYANGKIIETDSQILTVTPKPIVTSGVIKAVKIGKMVSVSFESVACTNAQQNAVLVDGLPPALLYTGSVCTIPTNGSTDIFIEPNGTMIKIYPSGVPFMYATITYISK